MMDAQRIVPTDNYPLDLHYIKAVFLQSQFRHTVRACQRLLSSKDSINQPLHESFCLYYVAAAHDELARAMHRKSQAKLPALTTAELFYSKALDALPSTKEAEGICERMLATRDQSFSGDPATDLSRQSGSTAQLLQREVSSSTIATMSPPMQAAGIASRSFDDRSPQSNSDASDLSSHRSFDQIVTPSRTLKRDYSRISLLEPNQPPPQDSTNLHPSLLPEKSTMTSTKPFHFPHQLPTSNPAAKQRTALPKLVTHARRDSCLPSATSSRWVSPEPVSPESPVSPLGPRDFNWETSTVSPVSPEDSTYDTPPWDTAPGTPDEVTPVPPEQIESGSEPPTERKEIPDQRLRHAQRLNEGVAGMRKQLESHIALIRNAKSQLREAQSDNSTHRRIPTTGTPLGQIYSEKESSESDAKVRSNASSIQQERSYWSFTPINVKEEEKKKRIEAGRKRNWARERFRPERYRELAEKALAEL